MYIVLELIYKILSGRNRIQIIFNFKYNNKFTLNYFYPFGF